MGHQSSEEPAEISWLLSTLAENFLVESATPDALSNFPGRDSLGYHQEDGLQQAILPSFTSWCEKPATVRKTKYKHTTLLLKAAGLQVLLENPDICNGRSLCERM